MRLKMILLPHDQPFPLESLTPDSFERFCLFFLARLYPDAKVHRAGGQGHTQEGLDVDVEFSDGTVRTFQCKRIKQFGPQKVRDAIAAHTRIAAKKFILLSRVASPQARQVVTQISDWDIWDQEDISRVIRQKIVKQDQIRLVDTFFPGQRLALLGEAEAGPWQTAEVFFAPFMDRSGAFSHAWDMVGRQDDVQAVVDCLANRITPMVLLVGAGGAGKSRILKQVVDAYGKDHVAIPLYFLSPTEARSDKNLENLGQGKKVLVVDDAHDRDDLLLLFQYVANPQNQAVILLALRPYGLDYIRQQASRFNLSGDRVFERKFEPLKLAQATQLAAQVLAAFDGPVAAAADIARLTLDCTLATVMGAQIVAKERIHVEFAKNEDAFRDTLLGRFRDVIAGEIGEKRDEAPIIQLLNILALIQPFYPEDEAVASLALAVEKLDVVNTNRLIPLLAKAGVLFKRGGQYRISPDLLADFIIENACIGEGGISTGYAERVFDAANNTQLEHLLLNLGKLDWRRTNGDPSNSRLLDGVWGKLKPDRDYSDPHIGAVRVVASYQPRRTLAFAEQLIREGTYLEGLPEILKYVAYSFEHLRQVCECLWELGKFPDQPMQGHQGHAIRVLAELCAVELDKPIKYNEVVVEFALSLFNDADAWKFQHSPLNVLAGILLTEGRTTSMDGMNIRFEVFGINVGFVAELREKVIDAVINLLSHINVKVAIMAAKFLGNGLRYPVGLNGQTVPKNVREEWTPIFVKELESIERATLANQLNVLVFNEVCETVSWYADYGEPEIAQIATRIMKNVPHSLEARTILALANGDSQIWGIDEYEKAKCDLDREHNFLIDELVSTYSSGEKLRAIINGYLEQIFPVRDGRNPHVLYSRLIEKSEAFALATVIHALAEPNAPTTEYAGMALANIFGRDRKKGLEIATEFVQSNVNELLIALGRAYSEFYLFGGQYLEDDLVLLRKILVSKDEFVILNLIDALRRLAEHNQSVALELLKGVDLSISKKVVEDVMTLFQESKVIPYNRLGEKDIQCFLEKLKPLKTLDGHWTSSFIAQASKRYPFVAANFFMERVECATKIKDGSYRACSHGLHGQAGLLFRESQEFGLLLRYVGNWMKLRAGESNDFRYYSSRLFLAMFSPFDIEVLRFLENWADGSTPAELMFLAQIFRQVPPDFVFEHRAFVLRFLERAKQYGNEMLENARSAFCKAANSGTRSGIRGEPFPQDIKMKQEAEKAKQNLSRFHPAYVLYDDLQKHAEANIQRSLKERETFEDQNDE